MCEVNNIIPDWLDYYHCSLKAGMKHDRILSKLEEPIAEAFGEEFMQEVLFRLGKLK